MGPRLRFIAALNYISHDEEKNKRGGEGDRNFETVSSSYDFSLSSPVKRLTFLSLTTTLLHPLSPWLLMTEEARKQDCALIAVVFGDRSSSV